MGMLTFKRLTTEEEIELHSQSWVTEEGIDMYSGWGKRRWRWLTVLAFAQDVNFFYESSELFIFNY